MEEGHRLGEGGNGGTAFHAVASPRLVARLYLSGGGAAVVPASRAA